MTNPGQHLGDGPADGRVFLGIVQNGSQGRYQDWTVAAQGHRHSLSQGSIGEKIDHWQHQLGSPEMAGRPDGF